LPRPLHLCADPRDEPRVALIAHIDPQPVEPCAEAVADADQGIDIRKAIIPSLAVLIAKAEASVPDLTPNQREILAELKAVETRIEEGRLRTAVVGQFKRGRITLLNALLGTPAVTDWTTPITAIPSFVRAANSPSIRVDFDDAREPFHSQQELDFPNIRARYRGRACARPGAGNEGVRKGRSE
jgi:hypothetical protein